MMELSGSDLVCVRGQRQVFSGIGFVVRGGEGLVLVGPNGAGKSSLLRLIAGLLRPESGRFDLTGGNPELSIAEQAHYLGHQDALKPSLTVLENLRFWANYLNASDASLEGPLTAVGLASLADLPAGYLSAGQRRRLSIARLLAAPRPIWLLDEPTTALDIASQAKLAELMAGHLRTGGIVVAATHGPLGLDGAKELRLGKA
jgi:heme exporter protein A